LLLPAAAGLAQRWFCYLSFIAYHLDNLYPAPKSSPYAAISGQPAFASPTRAAQAQAELAPWGNLTGIRLQGQLLEVPTSLQVVRTDWAHVVVTGHERQRPTYTRQGTQQLV
jgi:hypothetical protein